MYVLEIFLLQDGRMRERWADLYLKEQALWLLQCRALTALSKGRQPGPEVGICPFCKSGCDFSSKT